MNQVGRAPRPVARASALNRASTPPKDPLLESLQKDVNILKAENKKLKVTLLGMERNIRNLTENLRTGLQSQH